MTQTAAAANPEAVNSDRYESRKRRTPKLNSEKPSTDVSLWPVSGDNSPMVLKLGRTCEQWHEAELDLLANTGDGSMAEHPVPVLQIVDTTGQLKGIIHLRQVSGQLQLNLSLLNRREVWQTGVWLDFNASDELSLSWCTDMSGAELGAVSLEISPGTRH